MLYRQLLYRVPEFPRKMDDGWTAAFSFGKRNRTATLEAVAIKEDINVWKFAMARQDFIRVMEVRRSQRT